MLSAAWGAAIVAVGVSRVAAAIIDRHTGHVVIELVLSVGVPIAIIIYMLKFSKSYPDRVQPIWCLPLLGLSRRRGPGSMNTHQHVVPAQAKRCALVPRAASRTVTTSA